MREWLERHRGVPFGADGVYFLMWPGWERELRSNRWHYARRWARLVPVTLLQPVQRVIPTRLKSRPEPRIPNCRVLEVHTPTLSSSYLDDVLIQVGQVGADMAAHHVKRPLLWCYNPVLVGLYAGVPAVARVFHATENYFDFDGLSPLVLECVKAAVGMSDLAVAVSEGVARSLRQHVPASRIEVVTNGCDYAEYSRYEPDPRIVDLRRAGARVAVYAGNINGRLDFVLVDRCVTANRDTVFAFVGPVHQLTDDDARRWGRLLREPNVRYFGAVDADDLPGLYGAANLGIIPYKHTPLLVENGFPLKALEMCATGLPVVSTWMKPIEGLVDGLHVVRDAGSFVEQVTRTSRPSLGHRERARMRELCAFHDYDRKFVAVLEMLEKDAVNEAPPTTRLDDLVPGLFWNEWMHSTRRAWYRASAASQARPRRVRDVPRVLRALLALWLACRDRALRDVVTAWVSEHAPWRKPPGSRVGAFALLQDLLRVAALRGAVAGYESGESAVGISIEHDGAHGRLVLRTTEGGDVQERPTIPGGVQEIVWQHSQAAIPCRLGLGFFWVPLEECRYDFPALTVLARAHPGTVLNALCAFPGVTGDAGVIRPALR